DDASPGGDVARVLEPSGLCLTHDPAVVVEYRPLGRGRIFLQPDDQVLHVHSTPRLRNSARVKPLGSRCNTERIVSCVVPSWTVAVNRKCDETPSIRCRMSGSTRPRNDASTSSKPMSARSSTSASTMDESIVSDSDCRTSGGAVFTLIVVPGGNAVTYGASAR